MPKVVNNAAQQWWKLTLQRISRWVRLATGSRTTLHTLAAGASLPFATRPLLAYVNIGKITLGWHKQYLCLLREMSNTGTSFAQPWLKKPGRTTYQLTQFANDVLSVPNQASKSLTITAKRLYWRWHNLSSVRIVEWETGRLRCMHSPTTHAHSNKFLS